MDITEINAIEYGGAIAHVAAAQLFQILTASENMAGPAAVNWFGGEEGPDDGAATVLLLAEYVTKRGAGGERLWIWGSINGLVVVDVPEDKQFASVTLARRLAFDMFASVCLRSFEQLTTLQEAEFAARQLEQRENPLIALEDSIFEPTGSLGELEKHAEQFLADLATTAQIIGVDLGVDLGPDPHGEQVDALQRAGMVRERNGDIAGDIPAPIPAMSIGAAAPATGEANEAQAADQGSEADDQAGADPERSAEVRGGDADEGASGPGDVVGAECDAAAPAAGEVAEAGVQVAQPSDATSGGPDGNGAATADTGGVLRPGRRNRGK